MKVGDKVRVRMEVKTVAPKDEVGVIVEFDPKADPVYPLTVYFSKDDTQWGFSEYELYLIEEIK